MPRSKRPDFIDWEHSESKQIVMDDLETGFLSLDEERHPAEDVWPFYAGTSEFIAEKVVFDQFELRLKDHRKQVRRKIEKPPWHMAALAHDRDICPVETHNHRGEIKFYLLNAYPLLAQDIKDEKHKQMSTLDLKMSRPEYNYPGLTLQKFGRRVKQAIRKQRMINWMEDKRAEKAMKRAKRRAGLGLTHPPLRPAPPGTP